LPAPLVCCLGAAAQIGIAVAFVLAIFLGFAPAEAASIGIIGGADGPTAIFLTAKLAPQLLPSIAIAAYSYMALIPVIQPPLMRLLTTKKERQIEMGQLRQVSKLEKVCFPILVSILCILLVAGGCTADWYADAGKSVPGVRRCGTVVIHRSKCVD
jgi:carboxybiotin decarboxylase